MRGFSVVSLMVVDEAARVADDLCEAVKPMPATMDGLLWLMSTPYGQRGLALAWWWVRKQGRGAVGVSR